MEIENQAWTAEDIVNLFEILTEMKEVIYFALGGIFGMIALLLLLVFFLTFKK